MNTLGGRSRGKRGLLIRLECLAFMLTDVCSIDTIGVHYSATLWRWYRNWLNNEDEVTAKYGVRWFKVG